MYVVNLTQHPASQAQIDDGVFEYHDRAAIIALLTFDEVPSKEEICRRAKALAKIAKSTGRGAAMIGGAPYLMGPLEKALDVACISAVYPFSVRESLESEINGNATKVSVLKHAGWITA